jgi:hypothetical protein
MRNWHSVKIPTTFRRGISDLTFWDLAGHLNMTLSLPFRVFLSRTQHSMTFHFILSLSTLLSFCNPQHDYFPLPSTDSTQTAYSIPSLLSPLFPPLSAFSTIFDLENLVFRLPSSRRLVSFRVELQPGAADNVYDVRLGRDWFSYCTTTIPYAQILLSDNMCLAFSSSPLLAVRHTGEFLLS